MRMGSNHKGQQQDDDEENVALTGKSKSKKSFSGGATPEGEKKNMSKVKCFTCHITGALCWSVSKQKEGKR